VNHNILYEVSGQHFFGQKSPAARARELFKPSTDSASLLVEIKQKRFSFLVWRFLEVTSRDCRTTITVNQYCQLLQYQVPFAIPRGAVS